MLTCTSTSSKEQVSTLTTQQQQQNQQQQPENERLKSGQCCVCGVLTKSTCCVCHSAHYCGAACQAANFHQHILVCNNAIARERQLQRERLQQLAATGIASTS